MEMLVHSFNEVVDFARIFKPTWKFQVVDVVFLVLLNMCTELGTLAFRFLASFSVVHCNFAGVYLLPK